MPRGSRGRRHPDGRRPQPRRQRPRGQAEARGAPEELRLQRRRAATTSSVRGGRASLASGWPEVRRDSFSLANGRPKAERRTPGRLPPLDPNRKDPAAASRSGRVPIPLAGQGQSRFLLQSGVQAGSPKSSRQRRSMPRSALAAFAYPTASPEQTASQPRAPGAALQAQPFAEQRAEPRRAKKSNRRRARSCSTWRRAAPLPACCIGSYRARLRSSRPQFQPPRGAAAAAPSILNLKVTIVTEDTPGGSSLKKQAAYRAGGDNWLGVV